MKKSTAANREDTRDASLRVSKRMRDSLKAAAAVMGRPLYDVTNEAINSYLAAIRHIRPDVDLSWVKQHWVFRAPFAQPIVTTNYLGTLPPHRTPLAGVYLANMAHVYPQDRGQNYSLRLGERMANMMLGDRAT